MKAKYEDGIFTITDNNGITWKGDGKKHWEQVKAELHSYACECKRCNITHYTSDKRLNCEYCGSSDPEEFTCTELKE